MVSYDALAPLVAAELPHCPDPVIRFALKQAAQDFFRQTELWRVECEGVETVNEASVALELPTNTFVVATHQVYVDGKLVVQSHPEKVATDVASWMTKTDPKITAYWIDGPTSIRVWPINTVSATVSAYVSVAPRFELDQLPDVVVPHQQTLAAGALWKLQSMIGKPWSNKTAAEGNGAIFNSGMIQARIYAVRHGMGSLRVAFRRS